jgi:hypothetical protein
MQIIDSRILLSDLKVMAEGRIGNLVKAVIDIERGIIAVDGELHQNPEYSRLAFLRALELLNLTIADPRHRRRLKELTRVREALLDFFLGDNVYNSTGKSWRSYFYGFAYATALRRPVSPTSRSG